MSAYLHLYGVVVSRSRANQRIALVDQDERTPQGFTAPETCPEFMAASDIDIRVA